MNEHTNLHASWQRRLGHTGFDSESSITVRWTVDPSSEKSTVHPCPFSSIRLHYFELFAESDLQYAP